MIRLSDFTLPLRRRAAALFALIAALVLASAASAVDLDFNVANGNYNVAGNWIDLLTGAPPASPPGIADRATIRNNGTMTINSNVQNLQMRIGHSEEITNPDYNNDGFVDAADYVLWRKGGPLLNDPTPTGVGPEDYTVWRSQFASPTEQLIQGNGTVNWTAGEITGQGSIGGDPYSGGPDIRVGKLDLADSVLYDLTGTVVQNGPTTKLLLPFQQSRLTIGDGSTGEFSHTPTSSYTLMDGTIGTAIGSGTFQNNGTNGNNGILVRSGTFTMTGGQIIDVTPTDYLAAGNVVTQRVLTIASSATGGGEGNENVATANLTGGSINSLGGIRVANSSHSRGYLNINGPITIVTGGDTQLGATNGLNAVAEMTMSAGTFQVGRTDNNPVTGTPFSLAGRFHVGDSAKGFLNMSGGIINVTRELVVANNFTAAGSFINMTGGTITFGGLQLRRNSGADPIGGDFSASIILDSPTAVFTHTGTGLSTSINIGSQGKALFEVRDGHATLGANNITTQLANNSISQATLNVKGGRLTLVGPLGRLNTASVAPVIGLTGGILEFNAAASGQLWQTDFSNTGSQLITKMSAIHQVNVGDATHPSSFSMSSGSWDLEIGSNVTATGADRFIVVDSVPPNADIRTASLTGGTLNISHISGYIPAVNDTLRILQAPDGVTLNAGAVTLAGNSGWSLITDITNTQIQLKYVGPGAGGAVPEPSTMVLVGLFASVALASRRPRRVKS